jgi:hypothetical protein
MTNFLQEWFFSNKGKLCSKWSHYFAVYERHLSQFRGKEITFVEIGIQGGGSLDMWRAYFGPQARLIGVDIEPMCLAHASENTEILIGDQADPIFLRELARKAGKIDILLDDGGHTMEQQINTFNELYPFLSSTGVYICEDVHTSYWPPYGGGLRAPGSFIEFAKAKIDELNAWHIWNGEATDFTRSTDFIGFYDSMVIIEKRPRGKPENWQTGKGGAGRLAG